MERVQARIQEETALACEHPLDFKTLLKRMLTFRDERVVACPVCGQKVRVEFDKGIGRWLSGPVPALPHGPGGRLDESSQPAQGAGADRRRLCRHAADLAALLPRHTTPSSLPGHSGKRAIIY